MLSKDSASQLAGKIIGLKLEYFGVDDVEIKSNWLRIPKDRRSRYIEPFNLSETRLNNFVEKYYEIILSTDLMFVASVVDKQHVQQKYGERAYYAPAIAYDVLLQRVETELKGNHSVGVTIDDMMGATPKGNQYKDNLTQQHNRLKQHGSSLLKSIKFTCLQGRLRFVNSGVSHLVQVADIAAYNVYRQFVDHGDNWEKETERLAVYEYFDKIACKFRQSAEGRIQGYGIVKFPVMNKVRWTIVNE